MTASYRRHDISDHAWSLLEPHLPCRAGSWGGVARNNRLFINAVFWILRTGAPWRDKGVWEALLEQLIDEPDYEWLMIDASHIKVHPHAAGAVGGNQAMSRTKRGLNTKYTLGRGCAWYAGPNVYYRRYRSGLRSGQGVSGGY